MNMHSLSNDFNNDIIHLYQQHINQPRCTCGSWWGVTPPPPCPLHGPSLMQPWPVGVSIPLPVTVTTTTTPPPPPNRIPDYVPED